MNHVSGNFKGQERTARLLIESHNDNQKWLSLWFGLLGKARSLKSDPRLVTLSLE